MDGVTRRPVRWASAKDSGRVVQGPGVLYAARLVADVAGSQEVICILRDTSSEPEINVNTTMLVLNVASAGAPDDWPPVPVALRFTRGVWAEFIGTSSAVVILAWDIG